MTSQVFALPAFATHYICWVDSAKVVGNAVRVEIRQGYEGAAQRIVGQDGRRIEIHKNSDGTFDLKEGDTVFISTLPHDSCSGKIARHDGKLGLELKATNCMPSHGCSEADAFVSSE